MPLINQTWRDLTATQRDFLTVLAHDEPATQREVADRLGVTEQWASQVRGTLETNGLVESSDRDGRTLSITLSEEARELVAEQFGGPDE